MIGMVVVTHGRLAAEFVAATEHVVGPRETMRGVCIGPDDDLEQSRADILDAAAAVDRGRGVLLLVDVFGSTPSNLAISIMEPAAKPARVEVIAGVNLPMLIALANLGADATLEDAAAAARDAGRKYISVASEHLAAGSP